MARLITATDVADMIAGQLDGEYDDGLGVFVSASHVGGSSQERMVDLDVSDDSEVAGVGAPKRFVILIRELE